jgi:putative DNA primase/helicase
LSLDITRPLQYAFSVEAQALFIAWLTELEAKVRDGTLHPALVSHLSKYRSLMPSLALHFELADNGSQTTVSLAHAQQAASWCSYLESHAKRVYSLVISPPLRAAAELGHHLVEDGWKRQEGRFTVREVCVRGWSGLETADKVRGALDMLADANWVRLRDSEKSNPAGGRPSEVYVISPRLKEVRRCQVNG